MGRVWLRARSAYPPPFPVPVCGVGVRAGVWVSAAPRLSLGGCWGVCVLVRPSRVVSCTSWLGLLCGSACLCARPACSLPFLVGVRCVGVRAGPGSRLCPPILGWVVGGCFLRLFLWACPGLASWCRLLAVPVPGLVVPVPPSPFFRAGLLALFFSFQRGVCPHVSVSLFPVGRCSWLGVAGFGWVVPLCLFLGVLSSVPSGWGVWPPLVVLAGGLVAVCPTTTHTWCTSRPSSISTISSNGSSLPSSAGAFCVGTSCWVGLLYGEDSGVMRVPAMLHRC